MVKGQIAFCRAILAAELVAQKKIEAADTMPFEIYRQQYVSAGRLGILHSETAAA